MSGKKTPADIIKTVSGKAVLSDEQKKKIMGINLSSRIAACKTVEEVEGMRAEIGTLEGSEKEVASNLADAMMEELGSNISGDKDE